MVGSGYACAPLIKEIGRGKEGARNLNRHQAAELYAAMLQGEVSELELGAVLIAFRVKGESCEELMGFCQAADALMNANRVQGATFHSNKPVLVFPSYNGARRRPNWLPLLTGALAAMGYPVLVHGLSADHTGRITTAEIFNELQWPGVLDLGSDWLSALENAHAQAQPLFVHTRVLHPGLEALLNKRAQLGVRNSTHTVVKLLRPLQHNSVLVTSYTHPEFLNLQREVLCGLNATALVLRGHEGEAVAHPQRAPRMDAVHAGRTWCLDEGDSSFTDMPEKNPNRDAVVTAAQTQGLLLEFKAHGLPALPAGLQRQIKAIAAVATEVSA